jgi:hypothetical protein
MNDIELRKWCLDWALKYCHELEEHWSLEDDAIYKEAEKIYKWVTQDQSTGDESTDRQKAPITHRTRCIIDFNDWDNDAYEVWNKYGLEDAYLIYNTEAMDNKQADELFLEAEKQRVRDKYPLTKGEPLDWSKLAKENEYYSLANQKHDNPKDHKWVLMGEAKEYYESLNKEKLGFDPILLAKIKEIPELINFIEYPHDHELYVGDIYFKDMFVTIKNNDMDPIWNIERKYRIKIAASLKRPDNIEQLREQYKDEIQARLKQ